MDIFKYGGRLLDCTFYYFRYVLGFRLDTVLNLLILIVAFTQLYQILDYVVIRFMLEKRELVCRIVCNRLLWALIILFPLDSIFMFGIYYVDIVAFPVALEVIKQLIISDKELLV